MGDLSLTYKVKALAAVSALDEKNAWTDLASRDVPYDITQYVLEGLKEGIHHDDIKKSLGMGHPTDMRWKKIMTCIRRGAGIDVTAMFLPWMNQTQEMAGWLYKKLKAQMENQEPYSRMTTDAIATLNNMQANLVKMGKDLGVFTDPQEQGRNGGGVTIVVQTMVPLPSKEVIIEAQRVKDEKSKLLVEQHRPKEGEKK